MRKILKSALFVGLVALTMTASTSAFFTSSVTAADNEIQLGTLLLAVDYGQNESYLGTWTSDSAWNVAYEDLSGSYNPNQFSAWTNAAPGDVNTYFVGVRQLGTIPAEIRSFATGEWISGDRFDGRTLADGITVCPADAASANHALVSVTEVETYSVTSSGTGCQNVTDYGCRNLRDGLNGRTDRAWTPIAGLTVGTVLNPSVIYGTEDGSLSDNSGAVRFALDTNEYVIYRVDTTLSTATDSCYQGASYEFDLTVEGKQVDDTAW